MTIFILFILGLAFIAYAVYANYSKTDPNESVPGRVWASIVAEVVFVSAAIVSWFTGTVAP